MSSTRNSKGVCTVPTEPRWVRIPVHTSESGFVIPSVLDTVETSYVPVVRGRRTH